MRLLHLLTAVQIGQHIRVLKLYIVQCSSAWHNTATGTFTPTKFKLHKFAACVSRDDFPS
jgi:hypothetical protein